VSGLPGGGEQFSTPLVQVLVAWQMPEPHV
jgi:hypothetical protein